MKKVFVILLLILITFLSFVETTASKKKLTFSSSKKVDFSLRINKSLYQPGEEINIVASIKPVKDIVKDIRTTVKITNYSGETIFKRTYFENKLSENLTYNIDRNVYLKPGGYKIFAKVTSYQKLIRETELHFGITPKDSKLNLIFAINVSTKPLFNPKGLVNNYTEDLVEGLSKFSISELPKNIYYSVSPLLLDELKELSTGYKKQENGQTVTVTENRVIPKKAKIIYEQLKHANESKFSLDQTFSISDVSKASKNEVGWQINLADKRPFLTNSNPSKYIADNVNSQTLFFNTQHFVFAKYKEKRLIGVNAEAGRKFNGFSKSSIYRFIAYSAEKMSKGKNKIVVIPDGVPSQRFLKSMIDAFNKTRVIKITGIPNSTKGYRQINLSDRKIVKTKLYSLIEDFEEMAGPKNYYLKKAVSNYLKYRHQPADKKTKADFNTYISSSLNKQFNKFSFKPQTVTLTASNGKVPIGIFSKANYKTNLKLKIQTDDFQAPKILKLTVKPGENAVVIPVKAIYSGTNNIDIALLAGNHVVGKNSISVNVILASTVFKYLYVFAAIIVIVVISAFIFREVRHRKIDGTR